MVDGEVWKKNLGAGFKAKLSQVGRLIQRRVGMMRAVDADADGDRHAALFQSHAFEQNAADLLAVGQNVVRPFDPEFMPPRPRQGGQRAMHGAGDGQRQRAELFKVMRRVDQEQGSNRGFRAPTPMGGLDGPCPEPAARRVSRVFRDRLIWRRPARRHWSSRFRRVR